MLFGKNQIKILRKEPVKMFLRIKELI